MTKWCSAIRRTDMATAEAFEKHDWRFHFNTRVLTKFLMQHGKNFGGDEHNETIDMSSHKTHERQNIFVASDVKLHDELSLPLHS